MAYEKLKKDLYSLGRSLNLGAQRIARNTIDREIKRAKKAKKKRTNEYGLFINNPNRMTDF